MVQTVEFGGQTHSFPDEATPEMIAEALGVSYSEPVEEKPQSFIERGRYRAPDRSIMDVLRDVGGGAAGALQRIGVGMGEAGQTIGNLAAPLRKYVPEKYKIFPQVNIREEGGLGSKTPVDLEKLIQSKEPDQVSKFIGGLLPSALAGGGTALGQIGAYAGSEALQAKPDEQNLFGLLPGGKVGAGIEAAGLGLLPYGAGKAIGKTASTISRAARKFDPDSWITKIQDRYALRKGNTSDMYNSIRDNISQRGISDINIPTKLSEKIENTRRHLAKTDRSRELIDAAQSGDYQALHEYQSDIGKKAEKLLGADSNADHNAGEELKEVRDQVNKLIEDHLRKTGNDDLADQLNLARKQWANLMDVYHPNSRSAIKKMVDPEELEIPSDPYKFLTKKNQRIKKLLDEHPDVRNEIKEYEDSKSAQDKLKKVLKVGGSLGAVGGLGYLGHEAIGILHR